MPELLARHLVMVIGTQSAEVVVDVGAAVFERFDVIDDDGLAHNVLLSTQHADRIASKDAGADLHPLAAAHAQLDAGAHRIDLGGDGGRNRRDGCVRDRRVVEPVLRFDAASGRVTSRIGI